MKQRHRLAVAGKTDVTMLFLAALLAGTAAFLSSCSGLERLPPHTPTAALLAKELVLYNWANYMPQPVLDEFERE